MFQDTWRVVRQLVRSSLLLSVVVCSPAKAAEPPEIDAASRLVLDGASGKIIAGNKIDDHRSPASLTKLMTAYVVFDALKQKNLQWDERVVVSAADLKRVAKDEAQMYLVAGEKVTVRELVEGLIVASANDAAMVLASRIGTTINGFARIMNATARKLGMNETHFVNPSGITAPGHYTTARDLSTLALHLTADFPEYYSFSSQQNFSFRNYSKRNKNALLEADSSFDGLKTGHTKAAQWCIVATAKRVVPGEAKSRRVFAVVLGAPTDHSRIVAAKQLVDYGFSITRPVYLSKS
ncbi:D-alanyl-D-alanine carboxypeptidase [Herbaspirillum seropedicae]|uniref:D-alanyl-D-alanine carboxypeptidase family protein n=1 Tax=Herbaspirillum seropedicae TaxID=964 RepID=UPI001123D5B9|nr:D-alanyl-D-alanine carboxypeptidase family protein [Herbaspirillum seropedicae]QDD66662.1 D-alanyl-D-alanine carboxypeptidase [Herbaspirillum seropedicae]